MSASLNHKLRTARTLLQNGDMPGARAICAEILDKAPRNPEALALRGITSLMGGSAAEAARDLRQALAAAPRDGMTLEYLGLALLNLGEFAEAEQILRRAAALPGAPASVALRLGLDGQPSDKVMLYAYLNSFYESGFANPIDDAIRRYCCPDIIGWRKVDEVPYDFIRKRLSV